MFQIPNMGLLYIVEFPFLIYGIIITFVRKDQFSRVLLVWLLVAPIVAAVTADDIPNIRRSIVMVPPIIILTAIGLMGAVHTARRFKKLIIVSISILFIFNVFYFLHNYFVHAKLHRPWYRNNGVKEMMQEVKSNYNIYDKIIMTKSTGGTYPLVLFYMQYDPKEYQNSGSKKDAEYTGFGKFFFVPQACPATEKDDRFVTGKRILYVESGECTKSVAGSKYISKEDGTHAFRLVGITNE